MGESRLIEISPVTRVEGHGKVTIHMGPDNQVEEARLHIVEFRGFERFIHGRLLWEVPVIVQRLCGICRSAITLPRPRRWTRSWASMSCPPRRKRCAGSCITDR